MVLGDRVYGGWRRLNHLTTGAVATRVLLVLVLSAATIAFFNGYPRYQPVGPELLVDPAFSAGLLHWEQSGRGAAQVAVDGVLRLQVDERGAGVAVRQSVAEPGRYTLLRLSGKLKSEEIRPGSRFWQRGRLVLVSFDSNQRMLPVPHLVADLAGTQPWETYQAVFRVPAEVRMLKVSVQLIGATGVLVAKNLSLRAVVERSTYPLCRQLGLLIWLLGLIWIALPWLFRLRYDGPHLLMMLAIIGIFAGTLMPAPLKFAIETEIGTVFSELTEAAVDHSGESWAGSPATSAVGHVLFFLLLAVAARWAAPQQPRRGLLLGLLGLALVSEVLQFFVEGRQPRLHDFYLDSLSVLAGLVAFELVQHGRQWWRRRRAGMPG
jgi:hypothetical protein